MAIVHLVLLLALADGPSTKPDPAALVAKLGSAEPAQQAAATESLKALGRGALPALETAIKASDSALGKRAIALWDTIERDLMTQPSLVRLDAQNRPMADMLEDLSKQTGLSLRMSSDRRNGPAAFREPAPVPFWTAVERLGLTSVYHQRLERGKLPTLEFRTDPMWTFTSTSGPFRFALAGLHLHHDRRLINGPWVRIDGFGQRQNVQAEDARGDTTTCFGELEVMVEPKMWFTLEAPARVTEASDDRGESLLPESPGPSQREHFAFRAGSGVTQVRTEFRLRPTQETRRLARLRGIVPVMLHLRRPAPMLVIASAGAAGKTFRCDEAEFTFQSINNSANGTQVAMTVRLNVDKAGLPDHADAELIMTRHRVMGEHQLELTDDAGKVLADSTSSGSGSHNTPAIHRWTMNTFQKGRATELRYYSMLRVRADAPFDFRDVPLP